MDAETRGCLLISEVGAGLDVPPSVKLERLVGLVSKQMLLFLCHVISRLNNPVTAPVSVCVQMDKHRSRDGCSVSEP
jgi:hypothetical protein